MRNLVEELSVPLEPLSVAGGGWVLGPGADRAHLSRWVGNWRTHIVGSRDNLHGFSRKRVIADRRRRRRGARRQAAQQHSEHLDSGMSQAAAAARLRKVQQKELAKVRRAFLAKMFGLLDAHARQRRSLRLGY